MLSRVHPLAKLVVCMAWLAASILVFDARFQVVAILVAAAILIVLERRSPVFVMLLMVPFALFGFGFLTTSLLFREDGGFAQRMAEEAPLGSEALSAGVVLFLRAVACGMISAVFTLTTDPGAFIKALMASWRLPPSLGFALFSAVNLVPDLAGEAQRIRLARAMRRGRPPRRIPGPVEAASLLIPLLAYAIRRATRAAISMELRGLGARSRTIANAPLFSRMDAAFVAAAFVLLWGFVILLA